MKSGPQLISAVELKRLIASSEKVVVIDVLPEEYFATEHLPEAKNACVYLVNFLNLVEAITPDRQQRLVVYGSSAKNLASTVAHSKLLEAGWKNVVNFKGGLTEWRDAGYEVQAIRQKQNESVLLDKTYRADLTKSLIEWTGRNIGGKHTGTLRLASGELTVTAGKVSGGEFIIDMNSMANTDLADRSLATVLLQHLMSEDFFETKKYPEGRFVLRIAEPLSGIPLGRPNYLIRGALTLKGIERELDFAAIIGMQEPGTLVAQANFDIDRTEWNVLYGSGRFFEKLGTHLVNDLISLQLKVVVE